MRARPPLVLLATCALAVACASAAPPPAASPTPGAAPPASPPAAARRPVVVVLATGGTIAGTAASASQTVGYTVAKLGVETLLSAVPQLGELADVRGEQLFQIASESITTRHLLLLARRVGELVADPGVSGVVITHGTDTLEESAYFLDLVVHSDTPVVLVGAMRPATALSADGPMNLYNAVAVAASPEARGMGVLVCLNDEVHGAREVTKVATSTLDAFRTPALGALGWVQSGRVWLYREPARRHTTRSELGVSGLEELPRVEIVLAHGGMTPESVEALAGPGVRGVVWAGTGNGSVPELVRPVLRAIRARGVVIVRSSRTGSGIVARNGEISDDEYDLVAGDNLTPQKARILLMLALLRTADTREIQRLFWDY